MNQSPPDTILFQAEPLGLEAPRDHWEQIVFVFEKFRDWLLERKNEVTAELLARLTELKRFLSADVYQMLLAYIARQASQHFPTIITLPSSTGVT